MLTPYRIKALPAEWFIENDEVITAQFMDMVALRVKVLTSLGGNGHSSLERLAERGQEVAIDGWTITAVQIVERLEYEVLREGNKTLTLWLVSRIMDDFAKAFNHLALLRRRSGIERSLKDSSSSRRNRAASSERA